MISNFNVTEEFRLANGTQPPEHLAGMLQSLQAVIDKAYREGYEACLRANSFKEAAHDES